jgi:protein involved in polysaccharide export with SLBB domain
LDTAGVVTNYPIHQLPILLLIFTDVCKSVNPFALLKPFRSCLLGAFVVLLTLLVASSAQAQVRVDQLTDAQIQEFIQKAQASGLTESQIEQAALSQGYSPTVIAQMRERLADLKRAGRVSAKSDSTGVVRRMPTDLSPRTSKAPLNRSKTTPRPGDARRDVTYPKNVRPGEQRIERFDDQVVEQMRRDDPLAGADSLTDEQRPEIFGASFFNNEKLTFEPNLRIPTPMGYVLGPDDELIVDIFGNASYTYKLKVSPEGTVKIENLAPILVSGLTIEQAQTRIIGRLKQAYAGLNQPGGGVSAQVSLGNIRSIRVTLTGELIQPGTYTVPSLATAFNALYVAGGPSENGSFRSIQILRGNRVVRTIDLYDFLLRADQKDNVLLRDGDVIHVPDYLAHVEVDGEVRRPMIYEVKKGETLRDVLRFTGGFTDRAYTATLTLERNTPRERRVANVTQDELATLVPQSGDKLTVGKILNRYENQVQVLGAVFRPGRYALEPGTATVRELLRKADGVREDAFQNRALLRREGPNLEQQTVSFDLGKLLRGEIPDIPLQRQDVLVVSAIKELREEYYVSITGAVNQEGDYDFSDSLRVADLIVMSGGFSEAATPTRIEVARRIKSDTAKSAAGQSIRIFRFDLDGNLRLNAQDARFTLRPFDVVYVRTDPSYEPQREVVIQGEVQYPGPYAIRERSERITNLIERAGGLRPEAFLRAARFLREGKLVATDLRGILDDPQREDNLLLRDGDTLTIPKKTELVSIRGAVLNPATVNFKTNYGVRDYVSEAGGFTEWSIPRKVYVTYANGSVDRTRKYLFFKKYPRMETGATITVPSKPDRAGQGRLSPAERVGLYSLMGSLAVALATVLVNVLNRP